MKNYIVFLLFLVSFFSYGQTSEVDSLKNELKIIQDDAEKLTVLTNIFEAYLFINLDSANVYRTQIIAIPKKNKEELIIDYGHSSKYFYYRYELDSSLYYTEKSLKIAIELNDQQLQSDFYRKMAILSSRKSNYEKATEYGILALEKAELVADWELIASAHTMLGNQYLKRNDFDLAISHYLTADSIYNSNKYEERPAALVYDNLAGIYTQLKEDKALFYIAEGRKIYEKLQDLEGVSYNNTLYGVYYQTVGDYEKAVNHYEKALDFYIDYGSIYRINEVYAKLINCYSGLGSSGKANSYLLKSEAIMKNSEDIEVLFEFYMNTGQYFIDQKDDEEAIVYLNKAYAIINESDVDFSLPFVREISKSLSIAYSNLKDYKNAYKFSQIHLTVNDSIYTKNNLQITKEIEAKYQSEKKEQEITILKSERELAEQKRKSQRNLLLGGLFFTTIAGLFLFVLYRNRHKTNTKLKELDTAKSNFFANISHEFRTPLTLISNPIEETLDDQSISDEKREKFVMAKRNSDRLLSLVNQLLDLSKIDAGQLKLQIQKSNPLQLIAAISESFNYAAKQNNIKYNVTIAEHGEEVWFDKDALEKIAINLLSNAFKYTPNSSAIVCEAYIKEGKLYFEVKNAGSVLTKDQLSRVFQRFYKTSEENQGTGIGLSLVNELIELHHGSIKVDSTPEWTTFTVTLPVNKSSFKKEQIIASPKKPHAFEPIIDNQSPPKDEEFADSEQPVLLIVEDNADLRSLLIKTFESSYSIFTASNGEMGLALAIEHIPDIIISDIMMPIKDGISLTNDLKNDERTSHIPIILLTAKSGEENELKGIEMGADDYITKPFSSKILTAKVTKLIEIRKKLQDRYSQEVILMPKDIAVTSVDVQFLERLQIVLDEKLVESSYSIEDFSSAVGMSRMQLHRKLKALTGLSATEFIRSQRLKLAAQLLKKSNINVSQIGYTVGFNDHAYFSKCFKEMYKCTPTEYTKKFS